MPSTRPRQRTRADEESFGQSAVPHSNTNVQPQLSTANRIVDKLKRIIYILISYFILSRVSFFSTLLHSPHIRHEPFKVGLAGTIGTLQRCYGRLS